ncbi:MAG: S-adenosyl-l-methionine hydroxide adenosyltransferase [Dehalococcoidia bacterium]|nr:MAG: S-adenosyl-l-methionine hydroxide adenosyltransferase [Dehalococcoidia bacterium]TEU16007.1 MAG: S-adenosyl-l-methionine hydroxide adenosyltransferase [Dehalococcoidia bacterium]
MSSIITLTTDFGYDDAYVAALKGAILSINPEANIIDISHSIEPQNILQAAFILGIAYRYFPKQTIHVAIVDPGVGSERQGVIVKTPSALFVAPDNGILSYIIDDLFLVESRSLTEHTHGLKEIVFKTGLEAVAITDPRFWRHPVSPTFHGRDIFAPVAAGLSLGISLYEFGEKIRSLHVLSIPKPSFDPDGNLVGLVLYIDHFGTLITNIKNNELPGKDVLVEVAGRRIQGISDYYAQNEGVMAILGSGGYLEVSLRDGSACDFLGTVVGDEIKVISAV